MSSQFGPNLTPVRAPGTRQHWWKWVLNWLSPARLWRDIRSSESGHKTTALGFAIGVFIANTPLWGLHTVIALLVAKKTRLHPLTVAAGSALATPPIGPLLIAAAVAIGHYVLHGDWPTSALLHPAKGQFWSWFKEVMEEWTLGGLIVGTAMAALSYLLIWLALRLIPVRDEKRPSPASPDI